LFEELKTKEELNTLGYVPKFYETIKKTLIKKNYVSFGTVNNTCGFDNWQKKIKEQHERVLSTLRKKSNYQ
jgi:hypothetical protein